IFAVFLFLVLGLKLIGDNEVGILTKKMFGRKMPPGQIVARNGEIGVQADILMPGLYWRIPIIWKISKWPVTEILASEVGVVESIDGQSIPHGRLLGDEVECNHFQDAKKFLENGGRKGPQVSILRPGSYRINLYAFEIEKMPVTNIPAEKIGVVIANDGLPLPSGNIVAPRPLEASTAEYPNVQNSQYFQDGQAFLNSAGHRGPQLDTLQPGKYYINPLLFAVEHYDVAEVPPGYVAVLRSNVGLDLEKKAGAPGPTDSGTPGKQSLELGQPVHEEVESLLILDKNMRGIWKEPIAPGTYNLNPLAFTAYLVPTSAVTIDWASGVDQRAQHTTPVAVKKGVIQTSNESYDAADSSKATEFFKFSQLRVTSMDGFQLEVDVRMIIRIRPQNAAFIIARFGSVKNLIEQIVHPLIDSSFRNKAGEEKAINFIMSRTELQRSALEKAQQQFEVYHVEAQNLLIAYIKVDQALLDTQTKREIALQQQAQYQQEAMAQEKRIEVQSKAANADKQPEVVAAMLSIQIEDNKAEAKRRLAGGDRDLNKITADGEKYKIQAMADAETYRLKTVADGKAYDQREVGKGIADAYNAQAQVLGPTATAAIKLMDEVGVNKVKITPDILISAAGGDQGASALLATWLAQTVSKGLQEGKKGEPGA
ncbi:MAG: SPFH domain-containing protein, partial [Kiritimatiellaeota bacterium]|nr:SPFH domain-containing protein [Kiritimatiellota bacterium]